MRTNFSRPAPAGPLAGGNGGLDFGNGDLPKSDSCWGIRVEELHAVARVSKRITGDCLPLCKGMSRRPEGQRQAA